MHLALLIDGRIGWAQQMPDVAGPDSGQIVQIRRTYLDLRRTHMPYGSFLYESPNTEIRLSPVSKKVYSLPFYNLSQIIMFITQPAI